MPIPEWVFFISIGIGKYGGHSTYCYSYGSGSGFGLYGSFSSVAGSGEPALALVYIKDSKELLFLLVD